ncbi:caffeoylshikimate esterase-like protein [Tanacetum coccineum]
MPSSPPPSPSFFWGDTPEDEYYASQGVRNSKSYFQTPNAKIFTQSWHPLDPNQPIKATIFMTHGYTSNCSWSFQEICIWYAKWGYAVYAADLIGHGDSDGVRGYMGDMNKAAATSLSYFVSVRQSEPYNTLPAFLFGESLGGLITMLMYLQSEIGMWSGLIFLAPLFVIPEEMVSKCHELSGICNLFCDGMHGCNVHRESLARGQYALGARDALGYILDRTLKDLCASYFGASSMLTRPGYYFIPAFCDPFWGCYDWYQSKVIENQSSDDDNDDDDVKKDEEYEEEEEYLASADPSAILTDDPVHSN